LAQSIVSASLGLAWTPPFALPNSGNSTFNLQAMCSAQNVGQIDVPQATAPADIIAIPFGTIVHCLFFIIKNGMSSDIGVRLNGSATDNFHIPSGGTVAILSPQAPMITPLSSASIVTTATPGTTEIVSFWLYGN